jgi:ribosomal protein L23
MLNKESILIEPLVTEKATEASSNSNQYYFRVAREANRVVCEACD